MKNIDPDLLRSFLVFAESGTLAKTALIVGRTASAVTAQIQRLEAELGVAVLEHDGRGRRLTAIGEEMVPLARRIFDAQRELWDGVKAGPGAEVLRLGFTQDFADGKMPAALRQFATAHSRLRLHLHVAGSVEIRDRFARQELDIAITVRQGAHSNEIRCFTEPMIWLTSDSGLLPSREPLPLALLEPPCDFRAAALAALQAQKRAFQIVAFSPNLSGLLAAVCSGLAVMPRTARLLGMRIAKAPTSLNLPELPDVTFALLAKKAARGIEGTLADYLAHELA